MVVVDTTDSPVSNYSFQLVAGASMLYFDFSDTLLQPGEYYRIYYQFYDSPGHSFARGHGDILRQF